jgi:hypothetical protein
LGAVEGAGVPVMSGLPRSSHGEACGVSELLRECGVCPKEGCDGFAGEFFCKPFHTEVKLLHSGKIRTTGGMG